MPPGEICLDAFVSWLCAREHEVVGSFGRCYDSPLARYLSEMTGHVIGTDGKRYGCALSEYRCWLLLPQWAEVLTSWIEALAYRPVTGSETVEALARVELALRPTGPRFNVLFDQVW